MTRYRSVYIIHCVGTPIVSLSNPYRIGSRLAPLEGKPVTASDPNRSVAAHDVSGAAMPREAEFSRALLDRGMASGQVLRTVSYGKENPLCTEHDEACWSKNRRAHFVITSK